MRAEHGMLREVYSFCHDPFCSLPGSTFACFSVSPEHGPRSQKTRKCQNQEPANTSESRHVRNMRKQRLCQQRRSKQPLATKRPANKSWSAVSRLRRITIRRPPLAVRRACLRRRAFYASPCQATAPSLERFTHRAHSAGPLRPEVELTPSKVRKSNLVFIDFRTLFKTILGSKMEAKRKSTSS